MEGWHCISSAKEGAARAPKGKAKARHRRGQPESALQEAATGPDQASFLDTSRADGVMLLCIDEYKIRWKEHIRGRLVQASLRGKGLVCKF